MKQILISFCVMSTLLISSMAFAKEISTNDYYSTLHPTAKTAKATLAKTLFTPPTDITIINGTQYPVHVAVPASPIYDDVVYPGANDHIRHDFKYDDTHIVVKDTYYNVFFNQYVCRHAVIFVMGGPYSHQVTVDNEYCY